LLLVSTPLEITVCRRRRQAVISLEWNLFHYLVSTPLEIIPPTAG